MTKTFLVTNEMYALFLEENNDYEKPLVWPGAHKDHLVLGVSFVDAESFASWANTATGGSVSLKLPAYSDLPEEVIPYYLWTSDKDGESRVVRGGSWYVNARNLRSSNRVRYLPSYRSDNLGFRCARGMEATKKENIRRGCF